MKEIKITKGYTAIVDDEDFERLNQFKWQAHVSRNTIYVRTFIYDADKKGKQRTIIMHREIMKAKDGQILDHINHNGLDNRKCNLRFVSHRENHLNRLHNAILPGAFRQANGKTFMARIRVNGGMKYLGNFPTAELAHKAYMIEFNKLNKSEKCCGQIIPE